MIITAKTTLNMVVGYPLDHTQSPLLHNTIYQWLNISAVLLAFSHEDLAALMQSIKTLSIGLTAVTMPFKEKILPYMDACSEEVTALKAANTIIQRDHKLTAYNTDVAGIAYALRHESLQHKKVLILGAGGAARAAAYYAEKNQAELLWLNRTQAHAKRLAQHFGGEVISESEVHTLPIDVIINTTPLGLFPEIDHTPLPHYHFKPEQVVFDMVYHPINTRLVQEATAAGASIVSGLDMFIGQGMKQVELWSQQNGCDEELAAHLKTLLIQQQKYHEKTLIDLPHGGETS